MCLKMPSVLSGGSVVGEQMQAEGVGVRALPSRVVTSHDTAEGLRQRETQLKVCELIVKSFLANVSKSFGMTS